MLHTRAGFFVFSTLTLLLSANSFIARSELDANLTPIVGVLTQEVSPFVLRNYPGKNLTSYIAASYIKFVEGAGARAVPIWIGKSREYYEDILTKVNGILLPGGATYFNQSHGYADAGHHIFEVASAMNDQGTYLPIWGTCLGFELITYLTLNRTEHRSPCSSNMQPLPLEFKKGYESSRMFKNAPSDVIKILETYPVTANFHQYCITEEDFLLLSSSSQSHTKVQKYLEEDYRLQGKGVSASNVNSFPYNLLLTDSPGCISISIIGTDGIQAPLLAWQKIHVFISDCDQTFAKYGLDKEWSVLSLNHDWNNFEFISTIEHKKYPFYGVQYHPEKNLYEFVRNRSIPHSLEAIRASQFFADFFISETRKNTNKFSNVTEEQDSLIYNYSPEFTGRIGSAFIQQYLFEGRSTARLDSSFQLGGTYVGDKPNDIDVEESDIVLLDNKDELK